MTLPGAIDSAAFAVYVRRCLVPSLHPGQVVILDNLSAHKSAAAREAIEAAGCEVRFLPAYSPDFNPIELAFAKIKSRLRAAAARDTETLQRATAAAIDAITPADARASTPTAASRSGPTNMRSRSNARPCGERADIVDGRAPWSAMTWRGRARRGGAGYRHYILLDASVGLFPARGSLAPAVAAALLLISLIHAWWAISLAAGARGVGGGVASAAILGLGWTLLTNGSAIVYCMPPCPEGAPLTDVAHIGSLVLGIVAPAAAVWALWRRRARGGHTNEIHQRRGLDVARRRPGAGGGNDLGIGQCGRRAVRVGLLPRPRLRGRPPSEADG